MEEASFQSIKVAVVMIWNLASQEVMIVKYNFSVQTEDLLLL